MKTKLIVIDPAINTPENTCFNQIACATSLNAEYYLPNFSGADGILNIDLSNVAGVLIMGSGCSVHDNKPWQSILSPWIKEVVNRKIPLLGICYGHQLIAHLYGGIVSDLNKDGSKEYGLRCISFINDGGLNLSPLIGDLVVSHGEYVKDLPYKFETWGQSSKVKIDALKHESLPVWGVQPHPEANDDFLLHQNIQIKDPQRFDYGAKVIQAFLTHCETNA